MATLKFWCTGLLVTSWIPVFQCISAEECHREWSHSNLFGRISIPSFVHDKYQPNILHLDIFSTFFCQQQIWALLDLVHLCQPTSCPWDPRLSRKPFVDIFHDFCLSLSIQKHWWNACSKHFRRGRRTLESYLESKRYPAKTDPQNFPPNNIG